MKICISQRHNNTEDKMKNTIIETLAWIYSLISTFLFLKISIESLFKEKLNILKNARHNRKKDDKTDI